jgi:hypothetical protein
MQKIMCRVDALVIILIFVSWVSVAEAANPKVHGFVGHSAVTPAANVTVKLIDGESERVVDIVQTNFLGKYKFKEVRPGYYKISSGKVIREIMVKESNVRLDIDLSATDGAMNYANAGIAPTQSTQKTGKAPRSSAGPNNSELQSQIAGIWWGYSGSTERKIGLCPNGTYMDYSESSYSGGSYNQYGDQVGAWGAANQSSGQGNWTIQGDTHSGTIYVQYSNGQSLQMRYSQIGDPGCLSFDGNTLCRSSASCN